MTSEREFPGLRFDPAPGLVPSIGLLGEKVRQACGQLGAVRAQLETALRDPGAWTGAAGGSCHDAVQHIYPEVWIMHDALSGVEHTLGEWSYLLAEYQRSRTTLEEQAVAARALVKQAKADPDVEIGFTEIVVRSDEEREALLTRHGAAKQALTRAQDELDRVIDAAKRLKEQHDESAGAFAKQIRGFADHLPDRDTMTPAGSNIIPPYFTKPPAGREDVGPKREFDVSDPSARDHATRLAAMTMVAAQDAYFDNDRAASYMKHWLEGDGQDVQFDAKEFVNANPGFQAKLNEIIKTKGPTGSFDTGWQNGTVWEDMENGEVPKELRDFYYTMNGYQYRIVGTDFTMVDGEPVGQVRVDIYKRYNWGNPEGGAPRNDIEGVPQNDLARLNETGLAHDFDIVGSTTFYAAPRPA
ncbi:hypothetical protein [Streptomyces sp. SID3343]|uniref:hypothetical protein n=1 Tax=Streptomyces sp. SID3343 TaxID=2690260 RepID=UPI001371DE18|nr:hypothetical protein [Streptomyces sp. SID3343]MYW04136.1 hypothetical protein [Streptomyces sp. SID3343]